MNYGDRADIPPWSMFLTGTTTFLQIFSKQNFSSGYIMAKKGASYFSQVTIVNENMKVRSDTPVLFLLTIVNKMINLDNNTMIIMLKRT